MQKKKRSNVTGKKREQKSRADEEERGSRGKKHLKKSADADERGVRKQERAAEEECKRRRKRSEETGKKTAEGERRC